MDLIFYKAEELCSGMSSTLQVHFTASSFTNSQKSDIRGIARPGFRIGVVLPDNWMELTHPWLDAIASQAEPPFYLS